MSETMGSAPARNFGRPHHFKIRILISRGDSAEADTDPDLPIDAPPTWHMVGMDAIADATASTIRAFHASRHDPEPELEDLRRRLPSLRVTLSRGNGSTWWTVHYRVGVMSWLASVRVVRAELAHG